MHPADLLGLGGIAMGVGAALLALPGAARLERRGRAALFASALVVLALPYDGLPLVAYLRGISGDLSTTTLVLAAASVAGRFSGRPPGDPEQRLLLFGAVALVALFFYPMALGVGMFDPYRLGYGDPWLVGGAIALALLAWRARLNRAAACLAVALLAWAVGACASTNLWDYLLDPLLAAYAVVALLLAAMRRMASARRRRTPA